ncbi:5'/3'-nucleotidase SurE [candidate division LCP-89 bacterium B3_LCP]|uniref:5'-nucleotidase SurE n=1 Tax=candidate division LCP-89 bacterium B3_LCP TaxID=2012998 RepID=A0A532UY15_UNCL8|nr:MAG: 5'/3'-nucleotidase SurE [candidate division LCP-89 bacterium B3_LCP]
MKVLLCNDDGIHAPGLATLADEIKKIADVVVVAPAREQSAMGHAITMTDPLRAEEFFRNGEFFGWGVYGTPADAVKLALFALLDERPDMLISGINQGSNTGINTIYSGTVSASTEGRMNGMLSFAISLTSYTNKDFLPAARFAAELAQKLPDMRLPKGVSLNVNVPAIPEEEIKGVKFTRQSVAVYDEIFHRRTDPKGRVYFWLDGELQKDGDDPDIDALAVKAGYISITPIHYDLTNYQAFEKLYGQEDSFF